MTLSSEPILFSLLTPNDIEDITREIDALLARRVKMEDGGPPGFLFAIAADEGAWDATNLCPSHHIALLSRVLASRLNDEEWREEAGVSGVHLPQ